MDQSGIISSIALFFRLQYLWISYSKCPWFGKSSHSKINIFPRHKHGRSNGHLSGLTYFNCFTDIITRKEEVFNKYSKVKKMLLIPRRILPGGALSHRSLYHLSCPCWEISGNALSHSLVVAASVDGSFNSAAGWHNVLWNWPALRDFLSPAYIWLASQNGNQDFGGKNKSVYGADSWNIVCGRIFWSCISRTRWCIVVSNEFCFGLGKGGAVWSCKNFLELSDGW